MFGSKITLEDSANTAVLLEVERTKQAEAIGGS
jgi:hypothetical protein